MADVFFSYSSRDRERVRPFHEALSALGFDVFWDQTVPAGTDWDSWIKEKLTASRSTVVFWSTASVASDNVRHEATVARNDGKLVPVLLDDLRVNQFPMGLFMTQAARLTDWSGAGDDPEWQKLLAEIETKATPHWLERKLHAYRAEVAAERKRREAAQSSEDAAEAQLAKEIASQGQLRRDREDAIKRAEAAAAESRGLKQALSAVEAQVQDLQGRLAQSEYVGAVRSNGVPLWGRVPSALAGLLIGAASIYVIQAVSPTTELSEGGANVVKAVATHSDDARKTVHAPANIATRPAEETRNTARHRMLQGMIKRGKTVVGGKAALDWSRTASNPEQCAGICLDASDCMSFVHVGTQNRCYLFSTRATIQDAEPSYSAGHRP
jgi:TIR domain/PAN domain